MKHTWFDKILDEAIDETLDELQEKSLEICWHKWFTRAVWLVCIQAIINIVLTVALFF